MISTAAAGHDVALSALIDKDGHLVMAFFAFLWPSSAEPAFVVTLMVIAQVSCNHPNPLLPINYAAAVPRLLAVDPLESPIPAQVR